MSFEKAVQDEIKRLRERVAALVELAGFGDGPEPKRGRNPGRPAKPTGVKKTSRKAPTAARRRQMAEHGRYLAAVRSLSKADKEKVKALRAKSVPAAIREAKRLAK